MRRWARGFWPATMPAECAEIAGELDRLNGERQAMEAKALEEAYAEADAEIGDGEGPAVLVTANRGWHPGVVGLIASRLKDRYQRPAIAIALAANGIGTGSGRSIVGVDLGLAVRNAVGEGILAKGGGHAMAAGLTVAQARLGDLRAFLEQTLAEKVRAAGGSHALAIDAALTARGANLELIEAVEKAGPFGAGHAEPVYAFPSHRIDYADTVGKGHVRLTLAANDGATIKAVAFRAAGSPLGEALLVRPRAQPARRRCAVGRPLSGPAHAESPRHRRRGAAGLGRTPHRCLASRPRPTSGSGRDNVCRDSGRCTSRCCSA